MLRECAGWWPMWTAHLLCSMAFKILHWNVNICKQRNCCSLALLVFFLWKFQNMRMLSILVHCLIDSVHETWFFFSVHFTDSKNIWNIRKHLFFFLANNGFILLQQHFWLPGYSNLHTEPTLNKDTIKFEQTVYTMFGPANNLYVSTIVWSM